MGAFALAAVKTDTSVIADTFKLTAYRPNLALVILLAVVNANSVTVEITYILPCLRCESLVEVAYGLETAFSRFLNQGALCW